MTEYPHAHTVKIMKYGERLRRAREHAKLTQAELENQIDKACSQVNISKLERGDATGSEFTVHFATACGVNPVWLATGNGEMIEYNTPISDNIAALIGVAQEMDEYQVDQLIKFAEIIHGEPIQPISQSEQSHKPDTSKLQWMQVIKPRKTGTATVETKPRRRAK